MRTMALMISLAFTSVIYSQVDIIPLPAEMNVGNGYFAFKQPVGIIYNAAVPGNHGVKFFKDYLKEFYDITEFKEGTEHSYGFPAEIFIDYSENYFPTKGTYELLIDKKGITIRGDTLGLFYGFQTLIQMLPPHVSNNLIQLPYVTIKDYPRFEYRGLHLDVGRHFMPLDFIKKYIDYIAYHKMNFFHWHLTEDQGWRIEIKKYPRLTQVGAWRNGTIIGRYPGRGNDNKKHGGFYTQEQIKEIVKYAADRYITIVPEIEMPGHGSAAIAAYPSLSCFPREPTKNYFPKNCIWSGDSTGKQVQQTWGVFDDVFCAGKEETFKLLQDVIDEVATLFPGKYIHVGGDECPKTNWKRCPNCQKKIKDNNLKDEHELQSYFIRRMEKYINGKGKTLIGWDEILEGGLAPNAIVMSWQGEAGGIEAAKQKHKVIMTPLDNVYLNLSQAENEDSLVFGGYLPLEKVYSYEPVPKALDDEKASYVLGAQGNVWTEYMNNTGIVEYMLFPRLSALSEVLWSPKEKRSWSDFEKKLQVQFKRYNLWKANYSKAYYDLKATVIPTENFDGVLWKLETKYPSAEIRTITHFAGRPYELKFDEGVNYTAPLLAKSTQLVAAISRINGKAISNPISQNILFNKATGKKITLTSQPSSTYKGDGAFTLVNGIQNEKGLIKSKQFLGFSGADCGAVIDLGKKETISNVVVHCLREPGSWIWQPQSVEVFVSDNGSDFTSVGLTDDFIVKVKGLETGTMKVAFNSTNTRYVKIVVKNWGKIPAGNPGESSKAWLFVDEIEINPPTP
ncbi:MAG TPA: family 20 glycosylhydrolase [Chitinophagaceae bacterium]|nr:family 20 glycosylhydrolase [Chitinophagaceae bacterium]